MFFISKSWDVYIDYRRRITFYRTNDPCNTSNRIIHITSLFYWKAQHLRTKCLPLLFSRSLCIIKDCTWLLWIELRAFVKFNETFIILHWKSFASEINNTNRRTKISYPHLQNLEGAAWYKALTTFIAFRLFNACKYSLQTEKRKDWEENIQNVLCSRHLVEKAGMEWDLLLDTCITFKQKTGYLWLKQNMYIPVILFFWLIEFRTKLVTPMCYLQ